MPTCDDNLQESQTTLKFLKQPVNYGPHLLITWLRRSSTGCRYHLCCGMSVMGWDHCAVRRVGKAEVSARLLERILATNSSQLKHNLIKTDASTLKPTQMGTCRQIRAQAHARSDKKPFISSEKTITHQLPNAVDGLIKSWRGLIFLDV